MNHRNRWIGVAAVVAAMLGGCDGDGSDRGAFVLPEVSLSLMTPVGNVPLARKLIFYTNVTLTPTVTVTGGGESFTVPASGFMTPLPGSFHEVMILGLKPATTYTVDVAMTGPGGLQNLETIETITTAALPADFPPLEVLLTNPTRSSGVTFFDVFPGPINGGYFIAVDNEGDVVWFFPLEEVGEPDLRRMRNGNLLYLAEEDGVTSARQINMLGELIAEVTETDLGLIRFHHEMFEMENGNLLTYTIELRNLGPYLPEDEFFNVVGENVTEFTWDGEIVNNLRTLDILDPFRRLPDFNGGFYNGNFGVPTKDWAHANAVVHDPFDDTYVLSLRHQDVDVKISRDGEIVWVLGQDFASTTGDDDWPFLDLLTGTYPTHTHAIEVLGENQYILYDNANTSGGVSRAFIFSVDPDNLTATQDFEYIDPTYDPPLCVPFVSDADIVPGADGSEHVLVAHMGTSPNPPPCGIGSNYILITEINRASKEKIFEIRVRDPDPPEEGPAASTFGYRAERYPSLYP